MLGATMRFRTSIARALWAAGIVTLAASPALAQSADDKAAAEALFDEGKRLFLAKKFAEACPRFEASNRLDPGIGTLLYLADCYESSGKVASAWATFREAAAAAKAAGQGDRETVARGRAALLEPKLYRLTINVTSPASGLKITRNEAEVKRETWNAAVPVDPGSYTITASAPGKIAWSGSLAIPEGAGEKSITIPALVDDPKAAAKGAPPPPPPPPPPAETGLGGQRIAGIAIGALGVIGLGVSGALTGVAASKNSDAKALCPTVKCGSQEGVDASKQAGKMADAATALVIVGGVAAAGGLVLILTAPKRNKQPDTRAWIAPAIGPGVAGISAGRTW
jgi:serine/threonine-protein kinase